MLDIFKTFKFNYNTQINRADNDGAEKCSLDPSSKICALSSLFLPTSFKSGRGPKNPLEFSSQHPFFESRFWDEGCQLLSSTSGLSTVSLLSSVKTARPWTLRVPTTAQAPSWGGLSPKNHANFLFKHLAIQGQKTANNRDLIKPPERLSPPFPAQASNSGVSG